MKKHIKKAALQILILCCFIAFNYSSAIAEEQTGTTEISNDALIAEELEEKLEISAEYPIENEVGLSTKNSAEKNGWVKESDGTKYYINGECVKSIVKKINGEYYGFDSHGRMQRSKWKKYKGNRYYLMGNGRAVKSIVKKINGEYYGFDSHGRMLRSKWKKYKENRYYLAGNGRAVKSIVRKINGEYYGFDSHGRMQKSKWKKYNGIRYYLNANGKACRNVLKKINGKYYYFGKKGSVFSGKSRNAVVRLAQSWVGRNEDDGSHREIIDIYNRYPWHIREYRMKYQDPWCAATVSALAIELGYTDIIPVECYCLYMVRLAKKMGIWMEDDAYVPEPGDFILYDWQDTGIGDNTGHPDHIGTVESVTGNTILVIEGNKKGVMERRAVDVNGLYIRGYITPKYDAEPILTTDDIGYENSAVAADRKDYPFKITSSSVCVRKHPSAGSEPVTVIKKGSMQGIDRITYDGWGRLSNKAGWIKLQGNTKPLASMSYKAKTTHGVRIFASYKYETFTKIRKGSMQGFCFVTRDNWAWLSNYAGWVKITNYKK
ncbi:MAG: hypothetical protein HDT39_17455 [Lachnospiraceae bacterium]|nr:hypothetical protein [Lachnospiraceae bacterium]